MCGIAGFTHLQKPDSAKIWRITQTLTHRGPDEQNIFQSHHVSLGAVRLRIVDLQAGAQPMTIDGYTIVFNGEIYNHSELREELQELGHQFATRCDTEVVLRAFMEWDVASFKRLRGMFAAALWQEAGNRLLLVRDRLGIKPLYYSQHQRQIYFGSEMKALFACSEISRTICRRALSLFLSLNYVPSPLTMVKDIFKLDPGTWL